MLVQIEICPLDPATGREGEWAPAGPLSVAPSGDGWSPRRLANEAASAYLTELVARDRAFYGRVRAGLFEDDGTHHRSGPDMDWTYSSELLWDTPSLDLPHEVDGLPLHVERWSRRGDIDPGGGRWLKVSRTSMDYNALACPSTGYALRTTVALCGYGPGGDPEPLFAARGWGAHPTADDVTRLARMAVDGYARYGRDDDMTADIPRDATDIDLAPRP